MKEDTGTGHTHSDSMFQNKEQELEKQRTTINILLDRMGISQN